MTGEQVTVNQLVARAVHHPPNCNCHICQEAGCDETLHRQRRDPWHQPDTDGDAG